MPLSTETLLECQALLFDWAHSIDTKAWPALQAVLAPTVSMDYSAVGGENASDVPSASFVGRLSSPAFLGNADIHTQHFIGGCKWTEVSGTRVRVWFQIRAAHWRVIPEKATVNATGHAANIMDFELVEGVWSVKGVKVEDLLWMEGDFAAIMQPGL